MKTLLKKQLIAVSIILMTACACTNNANEDELWNPQLPPITQTGANTFGCKINGTIMIPRTSQVLHPGGGGYARGVTLSRLRVPQNTANFDFIKAVDRVTFRGGVAFKLPEIQNLGVGEYEVETMVGGYVSTNPNMVYMGGHYKGSYYGSIKGKGKITITRYDENVISGTFYATLKADHDENLTIEITEGRFDFDKKTINTTIFN